MLSCGMKKWFIFTSILFMTAALFAQELPQVDIQKYQGPWYVIGYKPSPIDKKWHNTIESYSWDADKKWYNTTTTYNKEPGGKIKTKHLKLIPVENTNNAKWIARISFFIRADYIIYKIADDYSYVVIGHPKQKYLYIMARKPEMDEKLYLDLVEFAVKELHYDASDIVHHDQSDNRKK